LTASSFSIVSRSMSASISARSGGLLMSLIRTRAPASSITSIDLSGCTRPVM
jgi:hypothetical protein